MSIPTPSAGPTGSNSETVDLLEEAIAYVRQQLACSQSVEDRLRIFWAGVKAAKALGAADVVSDAFTKLATTSGLRKDLGWHAAEDIRHLIRWGLHGRDPFGRQSHGR